MSERTESPAPAAPDASPAEPASPRRRALLVVSGIGACALAAAAAGPSIALALAPLEARHGGGRWVRTIKLEQLKDGEARRVSIVDDRRDAWLLEKGVVLGSVWLIRRGDKTMAFSSVCPHLGCSVNAVAAPDGKLDGFACPCHTSAFDGAGKRTSGPSPRDLDALETKTEDGHVFVEFRRFRIGVDAKVET
jgi:Rieske Fe-S protein